MAMASRLRRLTCGAVAAACMALVHLSSASAVAQQTSEFPFRTFGRDLTGSEAVQALGYLSPYAHAYAAYYGMTPRDLLLNFSSNGVTQFILGKDGRLRIRETFFVQFGPPASGPPRPPARLVPPKDLFTVHSNPDARRTILLRFDKAVYDPAFIYDVYLRVAEDFSPFDVDVTLDPGTVFEPGPGDATSLFVVDIQKKVGECCVYSGEVTLKSFDEKSDERRLIRLTSPERDERPSATADVISHLLGHAIGLRDELVNAATGATSGSRYRGHATARGWWAPIMGSPGWADVSQWSRGEFNFSVYKDDSLAAIQKVIPLRADDAADTPDRAAELKVIVAEGIASGKVSGIIGQPNDRDLYAIRAGEGPLRVKLTPSPVGANTSLRVSLLDSSGFPISLGPYYPLPYMIKRLGIYFLEVSSSGEGDPRSSGFSDYGSLGSYELEASFTFNGGSPPVAVLSATPSSGIAPLAVNLDARGSSDDGQVKFIYWDFGDGRKDESGGIAFGRYVFEKPGTYTVSIRVEDNDGVTSTATQTITVREPGPKDMTAKIDLGLIKMSGTSSAASGKLYVVDEKGEQLQNAVVRYEWSGLQKGQRSVISQKQGSPILSLPSNQTGCFDLKVTGITLAGYSYDAKAPVTAQVCR